MDLEQSLAILAERARQPSNFVYTTTITNTSSNDAENGNQRVAEKSEPVISSTELEGKSNLELLNIVIEYQESRVNLYKLFDEGLQDLIAESQLATYPALCSTVTQKFSYYSACIIVIKNLFVSRNIPSIAKVIACIQEKEKEKLTLVAAKHLDQIQDHVGSFNSITGGKSEAQQTYLVKQIGDIEANISELVEELMCCKCDLID